MPFFKENLKFPRLKIRQKTNDDNNNNRHHHHNNNSKKTQQTTSVVPEITNYKIVLA